MTSKTKTQSRALPYDHPCTDLVGWYAMSANRGVCAANPLPWL